ncbi:MAG TPA: flagellar hook-associated protein FlgK [Candidatus Saccharimonadales bacterium]|nr:flagellar hook-associated protein FlgK [Candidatus Saccharimonadales bacterium]
MAGLITQLEIARRALQAEQNLLSVVSHNIANADTPGYSRQQAILGATDPQDYFPGQLGTGVSVTEIRRLREGLTDVQLRLQSGNAGRWGVRESVFNELQTVFHEPSDSGLSATLGKFFNAYQGLANSPEDPTAKAAVMNQAQAVVDTFHSLAAQLKSVSDNVNSQAQGDVTNINQYLGEIAALNQQIVNAESSGEQANDLRDRRDVLLDNLSQLVDISVDEHTAGEVTVRVGGVNLVDGVQARTVTGVSTVAGQVTLQTSDGSSAPVLRGELAALQELRDTTLPGYQSQLDQLASALATQVNALQSSGPAGANVFTGNTAASLGLDPATAADPSRLDAGTSGAAGDNSLALKLAGLRDALTMSGGTTTFQGYYEGLVGGVGAAGQQATDMNTNQTLLLQQIENQRSSVSGVNVEEEMTQLLAAQKSFQAASQLVTTVDTLMTTLINMKATA